MLSRPVRSKTSTVHHLILAEDFGQFTQLRELLKSHSKSISTNGRAHVYLSGEEIAKRAHEVGVVWPGPRIHAVDHFALCVP